MNQGQFVFSQIMSLAPDREFRRLVLKYRGNARVRSFRCWHQFLCLGFGQLSQRESLRDIVTCLQAHRKQLYHLGLPPDIHRSTFYDANKHRNWRIYADFARLLMGRVQKIYRDLPNDLPDLNQTIFAMDGSIIKLCLNLFPWANYQKTIGAVRLHALLNLGTNLPEKLELTRTSTHELDVLQEMVFEPEAIYIMDRGYLMYSELYRIDQQPAYFVARGRSKSSFRRSRSLPNAHRPRIIFDQLGRFRSEKGRKSYPKTIRCVKVRDLETGKVMFLYTNLRDRDGQQIAELYKRRWQIELFFKWIKQHLKIKAFWGRSENAVQTQIWAVICCYMLLAIARKKLETDLTMHEMVQISSVSLMSKTPLNQLFKAKKAQSTVEEESNQLKIWEL